MQVKLLKGLTYPAAVGDPTHPVVYLCYRLALLEKIDVFWQVNGVSKEV